jgi:hypothetical protein
MIQNANGDAVSRLAFRLLWFFVFTIPATQMVEIPLLASISQAAGIAAIVAGAVAVAIRRKIRVLEPVHMAMAGLVIWSTITVFWSVAPALTVQRIATYLQLFALVLLVWELCREERAVLRVLQAFVLGTIVPALSMFKAFVPGDDTFVKRAALNFNPESLVFLLALSLPVSYYLILREKTPVSAVYRLQLGIAIPAILLGGTAAVLVAATVGLTLVCWTFHALSAHTRIRGCVAALIVIGAGLVFIPTSVLNHLAAESQNGGLTFTAALQNTIASIPTTPVGGFGAGALVATPSAKPSFMMFSETGIVGVLCLALLLGLLSLTAERLSGATKSFWFTVLAVWAVGTFTTNWEYSQPAWLFIGLLAAHAGSLRQEGVTNEEQKQKRKYYVETTAEVWS